MNAIVRDTLEWLEASGSRVKSKQELLDKIKDIRNWLTEEIDEFEHAVIHNDRPGMLNAVVDGMWILNNLSYHAGLEPGEIDDEGLLVMHSNFSKYCKTREEAQESVRLYAEGLHPNKMGVKITTVYRATGNKFYPYVILKTDGKILKSHNFKDVNEIDVFKLEGNV